MTEATPLTPAPEAAEGSETPSTEPTGLTAPAEPSTDDVEALKAALNEWKGFARKHESENKRLKERASVADTLEAAAVENDTAVSKLAAEVEQLRASLTEKERLAARQAVASAKGVPIELLPDTDDTAALETFAESLLGYKGTTSKTASAGAVAPTPPGSGRVITTKVDWADVIGHRKTR